jgi:hypothetical protein
MHCGSLLGKAKPAEPDRGSKPTYCQTANTKFCGDELVQLDNLA